MLQQAILIRGPIGLCRRSQKRHGMRFYTDAWNPELLAFYNCCAGAAEWIEAHCGSVRVEPMQVVPHEMWRERQHESIPVVRWSIFGIQTVGVGV